MNYFNLIVWLIHGKNIVKKKNRENYFVILQKQFKSYFFKHKNCFTYILGVE